MEPPLNGATVGVEGAESSGDGSALLPGGVTTAPGMTVTRTVTGSLEPALSLRPVGRRRPDGPRGGSHRRRCQRGSQRASGGGLGGDGRCDAHGASRRRLRPFGAGAQHRSRGPGCCRPGARPVRAIRSLLACRLRVRDRQPNPEQQPGHQKRAALAARVPRRRLPSRLDQLARRRQAEALPRRVRGATAERGSSRPATAADRRGPPEPRDECAAPGGRRLRLPRDPRRRLPPRAAALLAGDHEGYHQDYRGATEDLATTLNRGWLTWASAPHTGARRAARTRTGRRCRTSRAASRTTARSATARSAIGCTMRSPRRRTALPLCSAATPLLFMAREWATSTPFQFFTDHNPELGHAVTERRRSEFRARSAFTDPAVRDDPRPAGGRDLRAQQARLGGARGRAARLDAATLRGAAAAAAASRRCAGPRAPRSARSRVTRTGCCCDGDAADHALAVVARLRGGPATVEPGAELLGDRRWTVLATTEDAAFAVDPAAIEVETEGRAPRITFQRPGAVLRGTTLT